MHNAQCTMHNSVFYPQDEILNLCNHMAYCRYAAFICEYIYLNTVELLRGSVRYFLQRINNDVKDILSTLNPRGAVQDVYKVMRG